MFILNNIFILSYYICESFFFFDFMHNLFSIKTIFTFKQSVLSFFLLSISIFILQFGTNLTFIIPIIKYVSFTIASSLIFKGSIKNKIIQSTIFFLSIFLISYSLNLLVPFNNQQAKSILSKEIYILVYILFSEILFFALCKAIILILRLKNRPASGVYITCLVNSIIISLVGTACLMEITHKLCSYTSINKYIIIIVFCWVAVNLGIYLSFISIWKSTIEKERFEIIELKNNFMEKHIRNKNHYDMEVRKISHDMDNHLNCIAFLLKKDKPDDALKYVEEIIAYKKHYHVVSTGNPIIDAVISEKKSLAEKYNIQFDYKVQINDEITINSVDLCSFLSNAIDNALEGATSLPDVGDRKVALNIHTKKGYFCIHIENSVRDDPSHLFNNSITTKDNKYKHGLGVMSMKNVVQSYSGNMTSTYSDGFFAVKSILKL